MNTTGDIASVSTDKTDTLKFTSGIRAIFQDSQGKYWFGSHNEGVCSFDGETYQYFTTEDGLLNKQIRSIKEDAEGNIWFETAIGPNSYDGQKIMSYAPITQVFLMPMIPPITGQNLWFNAGNDPGVFHFDGRDLNYLKFPLPPKVNQYDSYGVTDITTDNKGVVWIATYSALFYFDGQEIKMLDEDRLPLEGGGYIHIRSILSDSKGRLWIGNNGVGVLLIDGDSIINFSDKMKLIHPDSHRNGDNSPVGTMEHVFTITEDHEGNIWFGDRDTGTWKYDGATITNYTIDNNLDSKLAWSIYNDQDHNLLFGMANGSIYKFDGELFDRIH